MNFFMLPGHIATLFVGFKFALILTFENPITGYGGASHAEISIFRDLSFNKGQTIIINPKTDKLDTNLVIFTKNRKYNFYIKFDKERAFKFVDVYNGKINNSYVLKREANSYKYYEGKTSVKIANKQKYPIYVNGRKVKRVQYFSKGIPLFIKKNPEKNIANGKMIIEDFL